MSAANETEIPNSAFSPPQSPPQRKEKNPRMQPEIPQNLIFDEILPRIPAKNLVRFKLVCHQWNSFISYPTTHFGDTHLSLSSTLNSRSVLTINRLHSFFEAVEYENGGLNLTKFGTDLEVLPIVRFLLASCNGLVFMISVHDQKLKWKSKIDVDHIESILNLPESLHQFEFHYLVGNPVLGIDSFVQIDHPNDQIYLSNIDNTSYKTVYYQHYNFGFGYVSSLDDYNIVFITLPMSPRSPEVVVNVYSLRSSRWVKPRKYKQNRLPLDFPRCFLGIESGTLVKETLHWSVIIGMEQKCIAAFDLAAQRDEFKFMQLPYSDFGDPERPLHDGSAFRLCCLDNCLCACAIYVDVDGDDYVEMWMLKEYGRHESWTKLFLIEPALYFGFTKGGMGLIYSPRRTELWLADFSCNPPQTMDISVVGINEAVDYVQSLVSPLAIISEPKAIKN